MNSTLPVLSPRKHGFTDFVLNRRRVSLLGGGLLLILSLIGAVANPVNAAGVTPWLNTAGPGGGTVYSYVPAGFNCGIALNRTCHYLEVAGSDWDARNRRWSSNEHSVTGTATSTGTGAKNTALIVAGNSTLGYAATDTNNFVSNTGLDDWFLPSRDEAQRLDSSAYSTYFGEVGTSSQQSGTIWITYESRSNSFVTDSHKREAFKVLAVRAFSQSDSSLASLTVAGEVLAPSFDPSVTVYSLTTEQESVQFTPVAVGASSVRVGAITVANGSQSASIALSPGSNSISLTVVAADSSSTSYTVNVTRLVSNYEVSFNGNDSTSGSPPSNQTKTDGVDLTLASNSGSLVKTGYTFDGWNTAADGSGTSYAVGASYGLDAAETLYAKWTANSLTVTYDSQEGSSATGGSLSTTTGGTLESLPTTSREGHVFNGWFTASTGGSEVTTSSPHGRTASFSLYAQWSVNTYVVSFDGNGSTGGSVPVNQTKTHGVNLTLASNSGSLVKTGYTFDGWNTAADGLGTSYAAGASYGVDAAETLYAKWTANPLRVTYNSQSGSSVSAGSTTSGGVIASAPVAPTRTGYVFTGWFTASTGGSAITFPYTHGQTASFTLHAQWSQASLHGISSVSKIGTITTTANVGNTFAVDTESSSVSLRYPANGLPADTVIDVYLVNDMSRARSLVAPAGGFVVSLVVAWLAADGSVPSTASGKPLLMTITNSTIRSGAKTYAIIGSEVTLIGTAVVDGTVTVEISEDPEIVVVNPVVVTTTTTMTTTTTITTTTTTTVVPTSYSTNTTTAAPGQTPTVVSPRSTTSTTVSPRSATTTTVPSSWRDADVAPAIKMEWSATFPLFSSSLATRIHSDWRSFVGGQSSIQLSCVLIPASPASRSVANLQLFDKRMLSMTTLLKRGGCTEITTNAAAPLTKISRVNRTWTVAFEPQSTDNVFVWAHKFSLYSSVVRKAVATTWTSNIAAYADKTLACQVTAVEPASTSRANTRLSSRRNAVMYNYLSKNGCNTVEFNRPIAASPLLATRRVWAVRVSVDEGWSKVLGGKLPPKPTVFAPKVLSNGQIARIAFTPIQIKAPPANAPIAPLGAKVFPIGAKIEQSQVTPTAPVSKVAAGESKATFGGKTIETEMSRSANGPAVLSAGPATIALAGFADEPAASSSNSGGSTGLTASSSTPLEIATGSFIALTPVQVWLFSTPLLLAETAVDENGNFAAAISLPSSIPAGNHTLQIQGFVYAAGGAAEVTANIGVSIAAAAVGTRWSGTFPMYVASITPSVKSQWTKFVSAQNSTAFACSVTPVKPERNSKANIRLYENRLIAMTTMLKYNGCVSVETLAPSTAKKSSVANRTWTVVVQSQASTVAFRWVHDFSTYASTINRAQKATWTALSTDFVGQKLQCVITGSEPIRNSLANARIFANRNENMKAYLLKNGCSEVQINKAISAKTKLASRTKWRVEASVVG